MNKQPKYLNNIKKVYFSGIGGIGVSALAKMMLSMHKKVFGSDIARSEITDKLQKQGATIVFKQVPENITKDIDLFIYSPAEDSNHPERKQAKKLKIKQYSYSEFLGLISKDYNTISICGTHGKSTTTALTGWLLEAGHIDPMVIVGSKMKFWDDNFRMGFSDVFVVESCEWRAHMLEITPDTILINNLELDHPDYYKNIQHLISVFQKYVNKLNKNQLLIINKDDKNLKHIKTKSKLITFGIKNLKSDIIAQNIKINTYKHNQTFDVWAFGKKFGSFEIELLGLINVYNTLAAISVAITWGVNSQDIKTALKKFPGIWRRLEKLGKYKGAIIFSDYGHHPTAIKATLQAIKTFYPGHRIILAFQPHEHTRTKVLFKNFVKCFDDADVLLLEEIYTVSGREHKKEIQSISSLDLVNAIKKRNKQIQVMYVKDNDVMLNNLNQVIRSGDIVLIMGAGNIYNIISKLKLQN